MATPVFILLALTKEGLGRYRAVEKMARPTARFNLGLSEALVEILKGGLGKHGFETVEVGILELGRLGWHAGRKQYQSKALLKMARDKAKSLSDWHTKVLLITDADIYDVDTLFVAGQAEVNGRAAVVSFARLGAGNEERFLKRVLKETLHELGHTLGLGHCTNHDCVMFPSRVLADSDVKAHDFCQRCRTKAGRALSAVL
jgi:predicted Zn-dependent protease